MGIRRKTHPLSAWCLWQHRKVLNRNRTDARAVCQIGRSNGFSPDPIVRLRNPDFPPIGVSFFCVGVAAKSARSKLELSLTNRCYLDQSYLGTP